MHLFLGSSFKVRIQGIIVKNEVEFKSGNTPYLQYGNEILNNNVPWDELVQAILDKGQTIKQIANYAETEINIIENVLQQSYQGLTFRAGARIVALHHKLCNQTSG